MLPQGSESSSQSATLPSSIIKPMCEGRRINVRPITHRFTGPTSGINLGKRSTEGAEQR